MARSACVLLTYKRSHAWCSAVLCVTREVDQAVLNATRDFVSLI
jgi:hypothetical protein